MLAVVSSKVFPTEAKRTQATLWRERLLAASDLASALAHLHSTEAVAGHYVIFRDLKPSNLGFDAHNKLILFDFGLAKLLTTDTNDKYEPTPETGSKRFMAPECARRQRYDHSCDLYSFGLIFWQICALKLPYASYGPNDHQRHFTDVVSLFFFCFFNYFHSS